MGGFRRRCSMMCSMGRGETGLAPGALGAVMGFLTISEAYGILPGIGHWFGFLGRIFSFLRLDIVDRLCCWILGVWDGTHGVAVFSSFEELVAPKCERTSTTTGQQW